MSQLMRLWYLSHRPPVKAQASPRIRADSPEPSLFAYMKYGSRRRVQPKIRRLIPLYGCACAFEKMTLRRTKSTIISWAGSYLLLDHEKIVLPYFILYQSMCIKSVCFRGYKIFYETITKWNLFLSYDNHRHAMYILLFAATFNFNLRTMKV